MACPCTTTPVTVTTTCQPCSTACQNGMTNGECIVYNGPALPNIGVEANTDINTIFEAIDTLILRDIQTIKVTVPSANIKLLFTTPYVVVTTPGAGKFIQILAVSARMSGTLSTAYTVAGGNLQVKAIGATNAIAVVSDTVLTIVDNTVISDFGKTTSANSGKVNTSIALSHTTANPTLGTGDLILYISYTVITQ